MHHGQDHHVKIHQLLTPTPAGPCSFHCLWIFPLFGGKKIWTLREVCSAYESFGLGNTFTPLENVKTPQNLLQHFVSKYCFLFA